MFVLPTVIITGNASLRKLDVSGNLIGDDGIELISSELQHNNILNELAISGCGLSSKGIKCDYPT